MWVSESECNFIVVLILRKQAELPPVALEYLGKETQGLVNHEIKLDYDYWTAGRSISISFLTKFLMIDPR
jgi:tRNA (guanine37-N1)-methyltransferase